MSIITKQYNISIEAGADFIHPFLARDDSDNLIDLTGAVISAHLREYAEASDYIMFTATHNGAGGKVTLTMPHEDTANIPYSSGVYDVFITFPDTTVEKYLEGEVTVIPAVTKPINGEIMYLLSFGSENDFPSYGMVRRLYLSHASGKMYRWNGTGYVGIAQDGQDATIEIGQVETLSPDEDAYVENVGSEANAILNFGIPRGHDGRDGIDGQDGTDGQDGFSPLVSISKEGKETTISVVDIQGLQSATILDGEDGQDGADGEDGQDGADGFSPTVSISKSDGVTTVTITDADGVHTATINDGEDGTDGQDGTDGTDGVSPTVSISKVGKVTTVTITDALGDHTATINDGEDGETPTLEWGAISGTLSDQTDLSNALLDKAPVILNSASGSIASFSDGSPAPVTALSVGIEPVQDLHGYSNPWPAGGGINMLAPKFYSGIGYNQNAGTQITLTELADVTASGNTYSRSVGSWGGMSMCSPQLALGTYYLMAELTSTNLRSSFYVLNNDMTISRRLANYGSGTEKSISTNITLEGNEAYIAFCLNSSEAGTVSISTPMVALSSSAIPFAPYSNVCPISGHTSATVMRTGRNLFANDGTYTNWSDGYLKSDGTPSGSLNAAYERTTPYIPVKGGGTYTFSFDTTGSLPSGGQWSNNLCFYDSSKNLVGSRVSIYGQKYITGTAPENAAYAKASLRTYEITEKYQLELGSYASSFEPYQGTSVTIDLDGTRYGGVLNVLTGVLTVDKVKQDLKSLEYVRSSRSTTGYYFTHVESDTVKTTDAMINPNVAKNYELYSHGTIGNAYNNYGNLAWVFQNGTTFCIRLGFEDSLGIETTDDLAEWFSEQTVCEITYPLATPLTVQLTPQQMSSLMGQNAIWASTGDTSVEYRADTRLFIEGQIEAEALAIRSILTNVEPEMKASKNYTSGSVVIVGNTFLKLTSAVSNGSTFTVGSNCQKVTMAEWILSIV